MNISFQKAKQIVMDNKDAHYGQYVDLEMVLDHLKDQREDMDGAEAILRFLHEIAKRG
jgi:hypothetical protein